MHHIDEGLQILDHMGSDPITKAAYCVHPLFQEDTQLVVTMLDAKLLKELGHRVIMLVMEYRFKANSYLCGPMYDNANCPDHVDFPLVRVRDMLVADKIQNEKDFILYNDAIRNGPALETYFRNWLRLLGVSDEEREELRKLIL